MVQVTVIQDNGDLSKTLKDMAQRANKVRLAASSSDGDVDNFIRILGGDPDRILDANPITEDAGDAKDASETPEASQEYVTRQNKVLNAIDRIDKTINPR